MENYKELPDEITNIEQHFKVSAGPGAGKTTWLVNHVQNVLRNSNRLNQTQKIGCITYTKIGAETVENKVKLISGTERIDIGTIHSFLYRNVIKPFAYLIEKDENDNELFNTNGINGHIENRINLGRFNSWKRDCIGEKLFYLFEERIKDDYGITNLDKTFFYLTNITWILKDDNIDIGISKKYLPKFIVKSKGNVQELNFPKRQLFNYKYKHWKHGIMHHEDVLYFTYYIFKRNPRIVELLSNKFPYLFLDEFQDTTPLQSWIIKKIANQGSIIGVIGDSAQSIYEFAGAKRSDFIDFNLPNIQSYNKSKNFRSTCTIINFLNLLRDDIKQNPGDNAPKGAKVVLFVGDINKSIDYIKRISGEQFVILCRSNRDVNRLKHGLKEIKGDNLIDLLYSEDSTHNRPIFIHSLFKAYDYYENAKYKDAINELKKYIKIGDFDGVFKRRIVIRILDYLKENLDTSIKDIYNFWQKKLQEEYKIEIGSHLRGKNIHDNKFRDFLPFLSQQAKITSKIRTIHQAKGEEFSYVLVCLFDKTDHNGKLQKSVDKILYDYIINAKNNIKVDTEIGEETRIYYVAFSRAKEKLFISVPTLSRDNEKKLELMNIEIERI